MEERHSKWGLALGGGGARGIAHVGVLKVLQRAHLIPDVITGTSIGALVGGAFACRPDADALECSARFKRKFIWAWPCFEMGCGHWKISEAVFRPFCRMWT
ncbi:MAG: patatin-like phospholipase family protein [Deltaproteobacteria bacterium]